MGTCHSNQQVEEQQLILANLVSFRQTATDRKEFHDELFDSFMPRKISAAIVDPSLVEECVKARKVVLEKCGELKREPQFDSKFPEMGEIVGPFETVDNKIIYSGSIEQGLAHGWGEAYCRSLKTYYEGYWEAGVPNYYGRFQYSDGSIYTGGLYKGSKDGKGKLEMASGEVQEGSWKFNKLNGYATITSPQGRVIYDGDFKSNMRIGSPKIVPHQHKHYGDIAPDDGTCDGADKTPRNEEKLNSADITPASRLKVQSVDTSSISSQQKSCMKGKSNNDLLPKKKIQFILEGDILPKA